MHVYERFGAGGRKISLKRLKLIFARAFTNGTLPKKILQAGAKKVIVRPCRKYRAGRMPAAGLPAIF